MQESSIAQLFSIVKYTRGQGKHFVKNLWELWECGTLTLSKRKGRKIRMAGYLIKDTTREEREQIVAESFRIYGSNCDGCFVRTGRDVSGIHRWGEGASGH